MQNLSKNQAEPRTTDDIKPKSSREKIIILLAMLEVHYLQNSRLNQVINFNTLASKSGLSVDDVAEAVNNLSESKLATRTNNALTSVDRAAFRMFGITSYKHAKSIVRKQRKAVYKQSGKNRLPRVREKNNPDLIKTYGNKCGHDPQERPVFILADHEKKRPPVIALLIKKVVDYYFEPERFLPQLNKANGSDRQQRTERRYACIQLLSAILSRTDVVTLRVGKPLSDDFVGIRLTRLAEIAGLSFSRAKKASKDLVAAGLISVVQKCEKLGDETYKGYPAVRVVSRSLFKAFGLLNMLKESQEKLVRKARKKKHEESKTATMPDSIKEAMIKTEAQHAALKDVTEESGKNIFLGMAKSILNS